MLRLGHNIAERLHELIAMIVQIARGIPDEAGFKHVPGQLVRAGTSAGANYEEARAAESRADFVHKVSVATKELRETLFWIRFAKAIGGVDPAILDKAIDEASQLAAILGASARTARRNNA